MGDSLLKEGKPTQALGELLKAQELDPDDPQIHNVLGVVYLEKGMTLRPPSISRRPWPWIPNISRSAITWGSPT